MREVVVVSGVRTAIGTFGGSLKDVPPSQLGAIVVPAIAPDKSCYRTHSVTAVPMKIGIA